MSTRTITLKHNGFEIPIKITENWEETMKNIRNKLYFREKDLKKYDIFYLDDENYENDLSEDDYDSIYSDKEIKIWGLRLKNPEGEENDDGDGDSKVIDNNNGISKEKQEEITKDLEKTFKKKQKQLIEKFKKIATEKIAANNLKYEERIKKLEQTIKSLKEKNKKELDEINKIQEESVLKIMEEVSDYAEKKIGEQLESFNSQFTEDLQTQIQKSSVDINTKSMSVKKVISSMDSNQNEMKEKFTDTKEIVRDIYKASQQNMNKKKK